MISIIPLEKYMYTDVCYIIHDSIRGSRTKFPDALLDEFCAKYTEESLAERHRSMDIWVALSGSDEVVGLIALKENQLKTFFVKRSCQGQGIGRKLYTRLENFARERNVDTLWLEGSDLGVPVYQRFGFVSGETIHKSRQGFPYSDTYMEKKL